MKKRFLAIFIVVLMLFSQITVFATDLDSSTASVNPEDKLTDGLKEAMGNVDENEYLSIIVWLNDHGDDIVYSKLSDDYDITLNAYNEDIYLQNKIIEQINNFEEKYKNDSVFENRSLSLKEIIETNKIDNIEIANITEHEKDSIIKNNLNIEEIIETSEKNKYISDWRKTRKELNNSINHSFVLKLDSTKCKNIEVNNLLTCISLECQKSYIYSIAAMVDVIKVEKNNVNYNSSLLELDATEDQTTEIINEHHMLTMEDTLGYDGTGVRIGVLELRDNNDGTHVLLDENNVHIHPKIVDGSIQQNYNFCGVSGTKTIDDHATSVVSVLCGAEVNGYQGVAPDASIYFAPFYKYPDASTPSVGEIYNALDWVINDCNVSIINMSCAGWYTGDNLYYSFLDNYFDCLVSQYRVTIVVASGNGYYQVGCPGMAMNVITVGNLSKEITNGKYTVWGTSSYTETEYMSNKPDVVAYGVNVHMYDVSYTNMTDTTEASNLGTGTSLSAPQVAGLVALMMEANSNLKGKPDTVKSILTLNAEHNVNTNIASESPVPTTNTGVVATRNMTTKGGSGLIDIKESIKSALRNDFQRFYFTNTNTSINTNRYYFYANQPIEFSMCFEKSNHSEINNNPYELDINLQIINADNQVVFDTLHNGHKDDEDLCDSGINNVENYSVSLPETGFYTFKIYVMSGTFDDVENTTMPSIHTSSHNGTYASLNVSCGCYNKNVQSDFWQSYMYEHVCSSCNTTFCENYSYDVETTNINYNGDYCGYVIYTVKFRMNPYTGVKIDDLYSCDFIKNENSLYDVNMIIDGGNFQYTSTGYRQTYTYMFMISDSETGEYKTAIYDTIHIVYDNKIEYGAYLVN